MNFYFGHLHCLKVGNHTLLFGGFGMGHSSCNFECVIACFVTVFFFKILLIIVFENIKNHILIFS